MKVRRLIFTLLGVALLLIAGFLTYAYVTLRNRHRITTKEYQAFSVCGYEVRLGEDYRAFDYGSRPMAEVPPGLVIIDIRSTVVGVPPPRDPITMFEAVPGELAEVLGGIDYTLYYLEGWGGYDVAGESLSMADGLPPSRWVGTASFGNDCSVGVDFAGEIGVQYPESHDWSIAIIGDIYSISAAD